MEDAATSGPVKAPRPKRVARDALPSAPPALSEEPAAPRRGGAAATSAQGAPQLVLPAGVGPPSVREKVSWGPDGRMWTLLHARLQRQLTASKLLDTDSLLVAVSGGQDSVCLLQALSDLQPKWGWRLGVVHCDHGWRPDSADNAAFVARAAADVGLPCHVRTAPPGMERSEQAARQWRYACFASVAREHGFSTVVTAHTATDRAETLMLNLLRGSGPAGLVALARSRALGEEAAEEVLRGGAEAAEARGAGAPCTCGAGAAAGASACGGSGGRSSSGGGGGRACSCQGGGPRPFVPSEEEEEETPGSRAAAAQRSAPPHPHPHPHPHARPPPGGVRLVRPLLQFTRDDTAAFCEALDLPVYLDSTNGLLDLRRNRVRKELMPYLRHHFNPRLDTALYRLIEVLEADSSYLDEQADKAYGKAYGRVVEEEPLGGRGRPRRGGRVPGRGQGGAAAGAAGKGGGGGGNVEYDAALGGLRQGELMLLPMAMQRRVVHRWLGEALEVVQRGPTQGAGGAGAGGAAGSGDGGGAASGPGSGGPGGSTGRGSAKAGAAQVGFDDVAKVQALVRAPHRTTSDSLCAGLVAVVRSGWLVLRSGRRPGGGGGAAEGGGAAGQGSGRGPGQGGGAAAGGGAEAQGGGRGSAGGAGVTEDGAVAA